MRNFKSMIITKDRAYCPDHDEHSKMIEELGIRDDKPVANFVKIEITPEDLVLSENATFKDCYTKTIYQSGGWKLQEVVCGTGQERSETKNE